MAGPHSAPGVRNVADSPSVSTLAADVAARLHAGDGPGARDTFGAIVLRVQRRASRLAYHYLRDAAEADDAVQDAFLKAFTRIGTYRPELPFEVWFTRILINGCLDRQKARARRARWLGPDLDRAAAIKEARAEGPADGGTPSPEAAVLARERRERIREAVDRLPDRQRVVFLLCHYGEHSPREAAVMLGLNEATVRVHLFRAVRRLRTWLKGPGHL